ncbi:hypothetical protein [Actinoplanes sp. ATCC 53533]|uniref:hypothetical protein n=1 Tax=Actinoplanes sp. ATCC 53533 TaxID=1288362 RepID=UPI0013150520|nr:hypothetical protein [Actinoplanes sp. ATCC 53533]
MAPARSEVSLALALRGSIINRIVQANTSHARLAVENRRTADALSAHALVLFSADRLTWPFRLSTAIRLDTEEENGEDLIEMLVGVGSYAMARIAEANAAGTRWDPRIPNIDGGDGVVTTSEILTPAHTYIGLGVSTLDRPEASWRQIRRSVDRSDALHLPGQAYLYLCDGTAAHINRSAMVGRFAGRSTTLTNSAVAHCDHPIERNEKLMLDPDGQQTPLWRHLAELHNVLASA